MNSETPDNSPQYSLFKFYSVIFLLSASIGFSFALIQNPSLLSYDYLKGLILQESRELSSEDNKGNWFPLNQPTTNRTIKGLGYMAGYEKSDQKGVTRYNQSKAWNGLNFYVSGQGPEAFLVDMNGRRIHKWKLPWKKAFPKLPRNIHHKKGFPTKDSEAGNFWNKAYVYPNGDLLAVYEEFGFVKIDRDSNLLWSKPIKAHHDLWVDTAGKIYVLTLKETQSDYFRLQDTYRENPFFSDYITVLSPAGRTLQEYSIFKAFTNSNFAPALKLLFSKDTFHTNSMNLLRNLPSNLPEAFKEGRALISMRRLNFVGVMDLKSESMVWGQMSRTQGQHDARVTNEGNILLFDNRRRGGYSRILKLNPKTWSIEWELSGKTDIPFYSVCCGRNQPLPNGNILITDTDSGRAFEVTESKELVWEFYNPERLKKEKEYIAAIYSFQRYPKNYFGSWIQAKLSRQN